MKPVRKVVLGVWLVASTAAAILTGAAFWRAQEENRLLSAQIVSDGPERLIEPRTGSSDDAELAKLRKETREIHRLRGEITQLWSDHVV